MRYFIIGILILCLLIGLCWYAEQEISNRTDAITAPLELALDALRDGNETLAQAYVAQAAAAWEQSEAVLSSIISHDHTNGIGEAMAELPWAHGDELGRAVESVRKQVQELADMDRIRWKNIL